jgi:lipid-A-disaccharide synthase
MKYYLIAGEASGDLHASNLIKALKHIDADADFRAMGGDAMKGVGAKLSKHYSEMSFMGFIEVLQNISTIRKTFDFIKKDIQNFNPTALILIDFSGFNLRIAKWAHERGILVHYYIAPQVWASRSSRVEKIRAYVDHLYVTLPFELEFYHKHNHEATFVGHPLIDAMAGSNETDTNQFLSDQGLGERPIIALLPGSRKQEISRILPELIKATKGFNDFDIVVAGAPSQTPSFYQPYLKETKIIFGKTQQLLQVAHLAVVTSGTATLETALIGTPQVVVYKTSPVSYAIGKRIVTLKYISLVNLILDRMAVEELIQDECSPEKIKAAIDELLDDAVRERMTQDYLELVKALGDSGASKRTAKAIYANTRTLLSQASDLLD